MGVTRPDIEEAYGLVMLSEVQSHIHGILHVEKVSPLFSVSVLVMIALEQLDLTGLLELRRGFMHHAAHVPLMVFVRAEDIEVFQTDNLIKKPVAPGITIEEMFRKPIRVQGSQVIEIQTGITHTHRAVSIGRCGGGIEEPSF